MHSKDTKDNRFMPHYNPPILGLKLEFTMRGIVGWKIGDAFTLNEVPPEIMFKTYFITTGITQEFAGGEWSTKIKAMYRLREDIGYQIKLNDVEIVDFDMGSNVGNPQWLIQSSKIIIPPFTNFEGILYTSDASAINMGMTLTGEVYSGAQIIQGAI